MAECLYVSKNSKEYPKANLWFLKNIKERLEAHGWDRNSFEMSDDIVVTISHDYPYCHDTVKLIERTFSDRNWEMKLHKFNIEDAVSVTEQSPKKKWYVYTWAIERRD